MKRNEKKALLTTVASEIQKKAVVKGLLQWKASKKFPTQVILVQLMNNKW